MSVLSIASYRPSTRLGLAPHNYEYSRTAAIAMCVILRARSCAERAVSLRCHRSTCTDNDEDEEEEEEEEERAGARTGTVQAG